MGSVRGMRGVVGSAAGLGAACVLLVGSPWLASAQPDDRGTAAGQPAVPAKAEPPIVPFPHPLITEVLYAVPSGDDGDADGDGVRSATGDEFVELINPHSKPIRLKGYVLTDGRNLLATGGGSRREPPATTKAPGTSTKDAKDARGKGDANPSVDRKNRIRFEFPDITLQPGQIVVVFNGYKGKNTKAVGTTAEPSEDGVSDPVDGGEVAPKPSAPSKPAGKARARPGPGEPPAPIRLSMKVSSQYAAFANTGDCVLLLDPKGNGIHCIAWGEKTKPPEDAAPLLERAPEGKGSAARAHGARGLGEHRELDAEGRLFSPGEHTLASAPPEEAPSAPVPEVPPLDVPSKTPDTSPAPK